MIWYVHSGSGFFSILDPGSRFRLQGSKKHRIPTWIRNTGKKFGPTDKELSYFFPIRNPESEIKVPEKTYPGSRGQKGTGFLIRICNTVRYGTIKEFEACLALKVKHSIVLLYVNGNQSQVIGNVSFVTLVLVKVEYGTEFPNPLLDSIGNPMMYGTVRVQYGRSRLRIPKF
jgi:hypothetical protein